MSVFFSLICPVFQLDLVRVLLKALSSVPTSTQPEAGTLLLNFVGLGDEKERACSEVAAEMRLLGTWLEGWAGLKERDDRVRLYSSALASIVQTLVVVCNSTQARKDEVCLLLCLGKRLFFFCFFSRERKKPGASLDFGSCSCLAANAGPSRV